MSGRMNRGGTGAPGGASPDSLDSTSSAAVDATLEGELLRDVQNETEEKTGARDHAQGTSSSAPPSPSKVPGVGKNSAPPSPSKVPGAGKNPAPASSPTSPSKLPGVSKNSAYSSAPPSPSKLIGVGNNSAPSSSPPSPSKLLGVGKNSAPSSPRSAARTLREHNTDETRPEQQPVAHTRSEFAAVMPNALAKIQEAAATDAQGPQAAFSDMEQAMTGPSHKKVEPPKLRRDFSVESVASIDNANCAVLEEIEAINRTLIDTEITIVGDSGTNRITSSCDGTTIKLSYTAVALSPDLKSLFASYEMGAVTPVKLYVPPDYPRKSPTLIIDKADDQLRKKSCIPISESVQSSFPRALGNLPEPHLIKDIAKVWNICVRTAVEEFAKKYGGGTFSSKYGPWERCDGS